MRRIVIAALLAAVSWSAQANDSAGWHAGIAASFADFSGDLTDANGKKISLRDNTVGFKAYGQYQFNRYVAFEAGYYTTGRFNDDLTPGVAGGNAKLRLHGWTGNVIGYVPWISSDDVKYFAKLGYYDFSDNLSVDGNSTSTGSENGVTLGGGAVIKISDQFDVRADFDWFNADVGHLWSLNMGIQYNFGARHRERPAAAPPPPPAAAQAPAADAVPAVQ